MQRSKYREQQDTTHVILIMPQIALFVVATWLCLGGSSALTCHCLNNAECNLVNGSCSAGCERGWYGPGCQIGNLALKKPAFQSTTYEQYAAENAVNGIVPPPNDLTERNCSHTEPTSEGSLWWYVNLSDSEDFVLKNITIVNRQGVNGENLRNFYILYTSDVTTEPNLTAWKRCTFQGSFQSTTVATYTCENRTAIGRRVAVYLIAGSKAGSTDKLTLCEVYVDGYSYNATSMFQKITTEIAPSCESLVISFSTLPVVPPTYLVVQFRNNNESNGTLIERIRNTAKGHRSVTLYAMANRTYTVSVAPETCCLGSQCLENFTLPTSNCIIGQSTPPVLVTMPQYSQYALRKDKTAVNITSVNSNPCSATNHSIYCRQLQDARSSPAHCSSTGSCELDPRYNYTCEINVTFSDGFNQRSIEIIRISTADFSTVNITLTTIACNSVTVELENIADRWDLEPSLIDFYLSTTGGTETQVARVIANTTKKMSATFLVMSNYTYAAWAIPTTYWSYSQSTDVFNGSCNALRNCIVGKQTPVNGITTLQRKYIFKTEGCCASFADSSSQQCEIPISQKINCTTERNYPYAVVASENGSVCALKSNTNYTCNHTVYIRSGQLETYHHFLKLDNLSECSSVEDPKASLSTSAAIGGAFAGLVILIVSITAVVMFKRRRKNLASQSVAAKQPYVGERNPVLKSVHGNLDATEDAVYGNTLGMDVEEFERYTQDETAIFIKFSELRNNEGHPCTVGLEKYQKNRFKNILPYDVNRVLINEGVCNYINASYINGFNHDKKYIATQGPIAQTITDFWKMVWQENVATIIMLTDYEEQSKKKCDKYFPRASSDTGGISVAIKTESTFDTHCVSALNVSRDGQTRLVRHCHFLAWPDKSVPEHCSHLLLFYAKTREVVSSKNNRKAPVVVHCSAGVGRTGAFVALDYLLSRFLSEGRVDVDSCVLQLRDQRMNMVQTKEQYVFLHKVLLYGIKTFEFIRNATDLQQMLEHQTLKFENFIAKQFEILQANLNITPDESVYMVARSKDNSLKNRNPNILAGESKRPFLEALTGSHGGYINAVYCNGCYAKNSFIVTQWPLKDTIPEFWELVYDRNPSCVVLLHRSPSLEEYPEFYPRQGQSFTAGPFTVNSTNFRENAFNCVNEHELSVKLLSRSASGQDKGCSVRMLECDIFDFDKELLSDLQKTTSIIMSLQLVCKQSKDRPIIVICKDGATFCGLFVAATNSLHRLLESSQVQVFHTVDLLRASRPEFINNLRQYTCLYQLLSCHTEASALYENLSSSTDQ